MFMAIGKLSKTVHRAAETRRNEKAAVATDSFNDSASHPPPSYQETARAQDDELCPSDITAGFSNLQLGTSTQNEPRPQECVAHLKLLECFYRLKQQVAGSDGQFGVSMDVVAQLDESAQVGGSKFEDKNNEVLALLAEKRWQVYISRAVTRFSVWRDALEPTYDYYTLKQATDSKGEVLADRVDHTKAKPILLHTDNLPPIDVLMVWHSYMLNPRAYLEDCAREGRMRLWHTSMPWQAVADAINNETFEYEVSKSAVVGFEEQTHLNWNNLDDPMITSIECPHCQVTNNVPWTTSGEIFEPSRKRHFIFGASVVEALSDRFSTCHGLADKGFFIPCSQCGDGITHDTLCAGKFLKDITKVINDDVVMPGNVLGKNGLPTRVGSTKDETGYTHYTVPSKLIKAGLGKQILKYNRDVDMRMISIRDSIEDGMIDKQLVKTARNSHSSRLLKDEAVAIRRMMSRYWDNSSPFALDLVGAVTRQCSFVEKMHNIDWLHSPALPNTMSRLIVKYIRFIKIISLHSRMAVPTLDVDLAWHTHQLDPSAYLQFTVAESKTFVDHDDKVAETTLTDSFAWTSHTYQKLYGEPYSECTCWYCEAVRESHTSTASRLFRSNNATAADELHDVPSDPKKSVHISSHNAVRPEGDRYYDAAVEKRAMELERAYAKACQRADKKGRPRPKRDDYYYSDAYGYPVYMPAYAPFYGAMAFTPAIYPMNPGCMALGAGAVGNCCSGTCGANIAAGSSCAGMAGMGSCGGFSGGGCSGGGGGGGGCGGGGGGGGGGGCGGGGGGGGGC